MEEKLITQMNFKIVSSQVCLIIVLIMLVSSSARSEGVYPNVEGKQLLEVESITSALGIELLIEKVDSPVSRGRILSQIPPPETPLGQTTKMYIKVSDGLLVPDVLQRNVKISKAELEALGFTVEVSNRPLKGISNGLVAFVTPEVGARVDPQNEAIFIVASNIEMVKIPSSIIGKNVYEVVKNTKLSFVHNIKNRLLTDMCWSPATIKHYVTSSLPAPGVVVPLGSEVKLVHRSVVIKPARRDQCRPGSNVVF